MKRTRGRALCSSWPSRPLLVEAGAELFEGPAAELPLLEVLPYAACEGGARGEGCCCCTNDGRMSESGIGSCSLKRYLPA